MLSSFTVDCGYKLFSLFIISRKTRRKEFRFLLYEGFLAGFSIITDGVPFIVTVIVGSVLHSFFIWSRV